MLVERLGRSQNGCGLWYVLFECRSIGWSHPVIARTGDCINGADRHSQHWIQDLHPLYLDDGAQLPVRILLPTRGKFSSVPLSTSTILTTNNIQTRGKTLEEIDYLFATGDAKARLEQRFHDAAARAHDRADAKNEHGLDEVRGMKT